MDKTNELYALIKDFCEGMDNDYSVNDPAHAVRFYIDISDIEYPGITEDTALAVYLVANEDSVDVKAIVEGMGIISNRINAMLKYLNKLNVIGFSTYFVDQSNWFGARSKIDCYYVNPEDEYIDITIRDVINAAMDVLYYVCMINVSALGADQAYKKMIKDFES